jgi:protein-disulfide isomerase
MVAGSSPARPTKKISTMKKIISFLLIIFTIVTYSRYAISKSIPKGSLILGKKNAPITLYEYSSITCPHCANFHIKILPKAKKKYIDKGILCLVLVPYPLDEWSIKITSIIENVPLTKKWSIINSLYNNQKIWMNAKNEKDLLHKISHITNLKIQFIKKTIHSRKTINKILKRRYNISKSLNINTAPTFISGIRIWRYSISMIEINKICQDYFSKK